MFIHIEILLTCITVEFKSSKDPDKIGDDGTYSAFILPDCMENKRLNLRVEISGSKGRARVQIGGSGAIATEELKFI